LRENGSSAKLFVNFQNVVGRELERISRAIHEGEKDKILSVDPAHAKSVLRSRVIRIFGASFIVLWPNYGNIFGHFDDKNQDSVILTFRVGKFSLLLGGDAPGSVWSSLNLGDLKAKVLKFPHHGGTLQDHPDFWTSDQLIKAVDPDYIVVPVGKNNCYDHPSQEFNQAVKKNSHRVFLYTRDEGDIEFRVHTQTGILERLVN
jgi:beta-lactamase superfamily II metal-dependent hydrolase